MKTNNHDFLETIMKKAVEKVNEAFPNDPPQTWPTEEEVNPDPPGNEEVPPDL